MRALYGAKRLIEDRLCEELNLTMVQVPLIVDTASGVNDYLDRDGSRTPIQFHIANDHGQNPIDAEVVQAATKWKRMALREFGLGPGEGLLTDMRAVRKDYFLDHDHSAYVDQWDWEQVVTPEGADARVPDRDRALDLEGAEGGGGATSTSGIPVLAEALPAAAGRADVHARGGDPRRVSGPAAEAARDGDPPGGARRSSSTGSAGRSPTDTRTSCGPPTTTTGRPRRSPPTGARCTA